MNATSPPIGALEAALKTGMPIGLLPAYHAATDPRAAAITLGDAVLTRAELEAAANRRAWMLVAEGVGAGDLVTVALPNVDLIITGGANIYPAEVEAALDARPDVASSAVTGLPDADLSHRVHAIVQPRNGAMPSAEELTALVTTRVARYKAPRTVEFVDEPLRDDAGKVRRSALRDARL